MRNKKKKHFPKVEKNHLLRKKKTQKKYPLEEENICAEKKTFAQNTNFPFEIIRILK